VIVYKTDVDLLHKAIENKYKWLEMPKLEHVPIHVRWNMYLTESLKMPKKLR